MADQQENMQPNRRGGRADGYGPSGDSYDSPGPLSAPVDILVPQAGLNPRDVNKLKTTIDSWSPSQGK